MSSWRSGRGIRRRARGRLLGLAGNSCWMMKAGMSVTGFSRLSQCQPGGALQRRHLQSGSCALAEAGLQKPAAPYRLQLGMNAWGGGPSEQKSLYRPPPWKCNAGRWLQLGRRRLKERSCGPFAEEARPPFIKTNAALQTAQICVS